ncbi:hypothetical protein V6R21_19825 [Limibacter armeniacum]|uniref:hypothetical protein n=1 Tax=Limibacter armeniacum TaxID=466084 RepID=UPI002FE5DAFE
MTNIIDPQVKEKLLETTTGNRKSLRVLRQQTYMNLYEAQEKYNAMMREWYGTKECKAHTLKATHMNTARWVYDMYEYMINVKDSQGVMTMPRKVTFKGKELICPRFKANGAWIIACLGHEKPRRFDEHAIRCADAGLFFRETELDPLLIRRKRKFSSIISVNPDLIVYQDEKEE